MPYRYCTQFVRYGIFPILIQEFTVRRVPLPEVEKLPHILRLEVILVELHSVRVRQQVAQVLRPPKAQGGRGQKNFKTQGTGKEITGNHGYARGCRDQGFV